MVQNKYHNTFITKYVEDGDLINFLLSVETDDVERIDISRKLILQVQVLHKNGIFHRDIKSANVLLTKDNEEAKLADLNVSKISKSGLASTQTGTPYYASPEVWSDLPYNGKCDIWSMGCVLY